MDPLIAHYNALRVGMPSFVLGVDCSDRDPAKWRWITVDGQVPADVPDLAAVIGLVEGRSAEPT